MSDTTDISWCDHTFNMWWGCDEAPTSPGAGGISPECANCYAKAWDRRLGGAHWGDTAPRKFASDAYWRKPERWNAIARERGKRAAVFCQSMGDWAEVHPARATNELMADARLRLFDLISRTPSLDWLLLTKRAENLDAMLPWHNLAVAPRRPFCRDCADKSVNDGICDNDGMPCHPRAAWPNVWIGVTCGARSSLWRVDRLRKIRAAVTFVSVEPLLEHISADEWDRALQGSFTCHECAQRVTVDVDGCCKTCGSDCDQEHPIDWMIVGDESGHGRRPAQVDWIRTARESALRNRVAFHFKQWNGSTTYAVHGQRAELANGKQGKIHLPVLDGRVWSQRPEAR